MFEGNGIFTYIDLKTGVNDDGEKYIVLNVLDKKSKRKIGFVIKNPIVMDKVLEKKLIDFQDLKLFFVVDKIYNQKTRFSNWQVELIGVG